MEDHHSPARRVRMSAPTPPVLSTMLSGGDRRSIGRANEVVALVLSQPALFVQLIDGMQSEDAVVRARSADAAEKVSAVHPAWLLPHRKLLMQTLSRSPQPEMRWHVAPMLARLPLKPSELARLVRLLTDWLNDGSHIVRVMAIQALADLAGRHADLRPQVLRHLQEWVVVGSPAMKARGRKLLKQLDRQAR